MSGARVLVVDDSLTVRMDLAEAFAAAGFDTLTSGDAESARACLRTEHVDVLVLDVGLPDADGIDLLREIRETEQGKDIIVLLLSNESDVRDRVRGMSMGADEYVGKPYDMGYVITRSRELLSARARTQSRDASEAAPILLIDDSSTFREYISVALQEQGYTVVTATTGEEGLRLAATERPAAIIVDGILPGIDGPTVIRRVRLDAALRGVPCMLLTAAREQEAELRALDSGADAFVRKDEEVALILARLSALLRISRGPGHDIETASLLGTKKILAVDDSPYFGEHLAKVLESEGYDIILARTGEEAIELLAVQPVDCILLDLVMEGMGGAETCRRIKSSPGLRDVPVIVLTAIDDGNVMLETIALGADDCISKSANVEVLKARVRAQLRRRQFEDETRRVREQLLRGEIEAANARSSRELAEARAGLVLALERKNEELGTAYRELQSTQAQLVQSAKMASLGELVAGVAHEINNPLAFVLSHLDTVRRSLNKALPQPELLTPEAKHGWDRAHSRLAEMHLGLERIRELVVKLRTFSRLDEGEQKTVSVRECVESMLTILSHKTKDRIEVVTHYGSPDQLDCFPGILTQAIMNLVSNSIDAIEGTGTLTITTGMAEEAYEIVVTDSGHGIPPHLRDRVLEPFFTTKAVGHGTGLGLSIAYSIVRKHNGTLELTDAAGGGTKATIRLPVPADADSLRSGNGLHANGATTETANPGGRR